MKRPRWIPTERSERVHLSVLAGTPIVLVVLHLTGVPLPRISNPARMWKALGSTDYLPLAAPLSAIAVIAWGLWVWAGVRYFLGLRHVWGSALGVVRQDLPTESLSTRSLRKPDDLLVEPPPRPLTLVDLHETEPHVTTTPALPVLLPADSQEGAMSSPPPPSPPPPPELAGPSQAEAEMASPADALVALHLFGEIVVMRGGRQITKGLRYKSLEMIAYLAVHRGGASRDLMTEVIWGGEGDLESLAMEFRRALYHARDITPRAGRGKGIIVRQGPVYRLNTANLWVDVIEFERSLRDAEEASSESHRRALLSRAVELYRAEFCHEVDWPWLRESRDRYRAAYVRACLSLAELHGRKRAHLAALDCVEKAIKAQPYEEDLWRRAILIEIDAGNRGSALRRCVELRELLDRDLGVAPDPQTLALERSIRANLEASSAR